MKPFSPIISRLLLALVLPAAAGVAEAQAARDYVYIVGSSTVYPFATVVAERFGRGSGFRTPKVESTGSGGGFKLFCEGIGSDYPDISNSSRPIIDSEFRNCVENGVSDVIEIKIGYDGIVFANALGAPAISLTRQDIFLALAKAVPGSEPGQLEPNPHRRWSDVRPDLPANRIEVLGPPTTSGTRDEFVELAMEDGCRHFAWIRELEHSDPERFRSICHTLREDGAYIEAGENDNLIVHKLEANPRAFGIFGFSFLDQNADKIRGAAIDTVRPTFEAIADGRYPVSRALYFYVKKDHVNMIPGLGEFLRELTSEQALGDEGYLVDRGLIPMPVDERRAEATDVEELATISMAVSRNPTR